MKVLSVRHPWASLIVRGVKPIENRTWRTAYRGVLLIHASKNYDFEGQEWINANFPGALIPGEIFRLGGIIGRVDMVDCVKSYLSPWFFGPWGHLYINAKQVTFIPLRGELGFFDYHPLKGQII